MDASVICWTSLMFADASTVIRCTSRARSIEVWITWQQKICPNYICRRSNQGKNRTKDKRCLFFLTSIDELLFAQCFSH